MSDAITKLDAKILQLKQKREQLEAQQALLFLKEARRCFDQDDFSIELALSVLSNSWKTSSPKQKEEWKLSASTFRPSSRSRKKAPQAKRTDSES